MSSNYFLNIEKNLKVQNTAQPEIVQTRQAARTGERRTKVDIDGQDTWHTDSVELPAKMAAFLP